MASRTVSFAADGNKDVELGSDLLDNSSSPSCSTATSSPNVNSHKRKIYGHQHHNSASDEALIDTSIRNKLFAEPTSYETNITRRHIPTTFDTSPTSHSLAKRKGKVIDDNFNVRDPMTGSVVDHTHLIAQDPRAFSHKTLSFEDPDMERKYQRYFIDRNLTTWRIYAIIGLLCQILVWGCTELAFPLAPANDDVRSELLTVLLGAVLPITIAIISTFILSKSVLAVVIHYISALYIICLEPVIALSMHLNRTDMDQYTAGGFGAMYVVMLGATVFFLKVRFQVAAVVVFVCSVVWWTVFGIDYSSQSAILQQLYIVNAVALALSCIVCLFMSYELERSSRQRFQSENRLYRQIVKLDTQLRYVQNQMTLKSNEFDSPLEKAINAIRTLSAAPSVPLEHIRTLSLILGWLNAPNLLLPDWNAASKQNDAEQRKWLAEVVGASSKLVFETDDLVSIAESGSLRSVVNEANFSSSQAALRRGSAPASLIHIQRKKLEVLSPLSQPRNIPNTIALPVTPYIPTKSSPGAQTVSELYTPQVLACLSRLSDYNFPMFEFNELTQGHALLMLLHYLCVESGLLVRLGLDASVFMVFAKRIEEGYHAEHPFHNSVHAADVLHTIQYLTMLPQVIRHLSDLDLLSIYVAAAIHDYDHPGVTNKYLSSINHPLAIRYNNQSILESHHAASGMEVLAIPECDFLATMDPRRRESTKSLIVEMVLATDLAKHSELLSKWKVQTLSLDQFDPKNVAEHKIILFQTMIKCADVANPTKSHELYMVWLDRITAEFTSQGDRERAHGLPVSAYMDRDHPDVKGCQLSFCQYIVAPLFEAFHAIAPCDEVMTTLRTNVQRWENTDDNEEWLKKVGTNI
ncbi:hypothetical protein SmJEL517_g05409 [Synchytrium microbalum]|uniref:Phosphodiesterase n=1 Tax=Synchytrium microbalum TaxID=1806994 RepID=A0A507BVC5_9FUNG|nr:uncharacterized protein SmJEL517_g05409 [Synchytrium microbalum]TPX31188.1 hypothetical protein SmJEL517_g05409 [Synchytrium microbalum]